MSRWRHIASILEPTDLYRDRFCSLLWGPGHSHSELPCMFGFTASCFLRTQNLLRGGQRLVLSAWQRCRVSFSFPHFCNFSSITVMLNLNDLWLQICAMGSADFCFSRKKTSCWILVKQQKMYFSKKQKKKCKAPLFVRNACIWKFLFPPNTAFKWFRNMGFTHTHPPPHTQRACEVHSRQGLEESGSRGETHCSHAHSVHCTEGMTSFPPMTSPQPVCKNDIIPLVCNPHGQMLVWH